MKPTRTKMRPLRTKMRPPRTKLRPVVPNLNISVGMPLSGCLLYKPNPIQITK